MAEFTTLLHLNKKSPVIVYVNNGYGAHVSYKIYIDCTLVNTPLIAIRGGSIRYGIQTNCYVKGVWLVVKTFVLRIESTYLEM